MTRVYPSKRDTWLMAIVGLGALVALIGIVTVWMTPEALPMRVAYTLVMGLVFGFVAWIFVATHYTLDKEVLMVRSGPISWRIPLADIERVKPSRNPLSSPALSMDRLEIRYGKRSVLISPADREGFLQDLLGKCPHLRRQGEGLERFTTQKS